MLHVEKSKLIKINLATQLQACTTIELFVP